MSTAMHDKDLYSILGVSESATADEISKAYRKLARQFHPDRNKEPGAAEKFKEVNEAHSILSDPEKRQQYDTFRKYGAFAGAGFPGGVRGAGPGGTEIDLSDLFRSMMGGMGQGGMGGGTRSRVDFESSIFDEFGPIGRKRGPQPGRDIEQTLDIPFDVAIHGGSIKFRMRKGNAPPQEIDVKIPPGIDTGQRIRLQGQGEPGDPGQPAGDLIVLARVATHPLFRREGADIHSEAEVSMFDAALGTKRSVNTLWGEVDVTIPPGTQPGAKLRLKKQGVKTRDSQGDHYVIVTVRVPRELSPAQREAVEAARRLFEGSSRS